MSQVPTAVPDALVTACKEAFWAQLAARGVAKTDMPRLCADAVRAQLRAAVTHPEFADFYTRATRESSNG